MTLLPTALPLLFALTPSLSVWWDLPGLTATLGFGLLPLLEWVWGRRALVQPQWSTAALRGVMGVVLLQPVLLMAWIMQAEPAAWRVAMLGAACGTVASGAGIVLAHELGHRRHNLDRALARALLCSVAWGHYLIEHNRGHHRHAATAQDPATARREESLWAFLPRYWSGVWRHGVELSRQQGGRLNEAQALMAGTLALWALAVGVAGAAGLLFCVTQAAVALLLVGAVDYMEHWGLRRRATAEGKAERMGPGHIWDCRNAVSDLMLFNLPRHASHHLEPWRHAGELQHTAQAPQMPTGYAGMVLLTLVPPLYRRVMAPRLPAEA